MYVKSPFLVPCSKLLPPSNSLRILMGARSVGAHRQDRCDRQMLHLGHYNSAQLPAGGPERSVRHEFIFLLKFLSELTRGCLMAVYLQCVLCEGAWASDSHNAQ